MGSREISERLRREGNRLYKMVSDEETGLCLFERRVRATCAEELYMQALAESLTWEDRASCCKNIGMLNILRSKLQLQHASKNEFSSSFNDELDLCKEYLLRSISFLLQAKKHGARAGKAKDWVAHLETSIDEAVEWAIVESSNSDLSFEEALFSFNGELGRSSRFNGDLVIYREEARDLVMAKVEEKFKIVQAYLQQVQEAEEEAAEARRQRELLRSRFTTVQVERVSIQFNTLNISPTPSFYTPASYTLLQQYFMRF